MGENSKMEQNTQQDEIVINIIELFSVLWRRLWIVVTAGIGLALIAFLISNYVMVPKYKSTTQIYIMNKQNENTTITYSDLQSGTQLTQDYMTLVTSRPVLEQVNVQLGLNMKYEDIVSLISVENPNNTRILKITAEYTDPLLAKRIADTVRIASASLITRVMNIDKVNLVEEANIPEEKSSPNTLKNTIIGGITGSVITGIIIAAIYLMNDTIKTPDDVEKYLQLSVLSSIPVQSDLKKSDKKNKKKKSK